MRTLRARVLRTEEEKRAVYQCRHQVFTRELAWVDSKNEEIDEYDKDAIILAIFKGEELIASLRIIEHDKKWMFDDDFRFLLSRKIERGPDSAEASRFFIAKEYRRVQDYSGRRFYFSRLILIIAYYYFEKRNISKVYAVFFQKVVDLLKEYGLPVKKIGQFDNADWETAVPCLIDWDRLDKSRFLLPELHEFLEMDSDEFEE